MRLHADAACLGTDIDGQRFFLNYEARPEADFDERFGRALPAAAGLAGMDLRGVGAFAGDFLGAPAREARL